MSAPMRPTRTIDPTVLAAKIAGVSPVDSCGFSTGESLGLGALEQGFPPFEQRPQLVPGAAVRGERLDVAPVLGETALELDDGGFARGDLGFQPLELRRAPRRSLGSCLRGDSLRLALRLRRLRGSAPLVADSDVVGPAAVV